MTITHETRIQLKSEGIETPKYLSEFDEESISNISDSVKRQGGRVLDLIPRDLA